MIFLAIQRLDSLHNCLLQILYGFKIVVVYGRAFQMSPEPFNKIQVGGIRSVPNYRQPALVAINVLPNSLRVMNRTIV